MISDILISAMNKNEVLIVLGFFRETKPIGYIGTYLEIHYEKSAHVIMEAEKSCDLPSASWRPKELIVPVQVQRPENQEDR